MSQKFSENYFQWRARRGMKELDVMLKRFIDLFYKRLNQSELQVFDRLLNSQDTDLWYWLSGQENPHEVALKEMIDKIRDANSNHS